MISRYTLLDLAPTLRALATVLGLTTMLVISGALSANARGVHAPGHGAAGEHGMHDGNASFAAGRRHGNDAYIKAASEERDRLLNTQIKSICRGC